MGRRLMTSVSIRPEVLVNQSYAMQRVTGQQRYATEIASRLLQDDKFKPVAPNRFWARSTGRVWTWIQFVLPWLARGSLLLSMTSRAPWWRPMPPARRLRTGMAPTARSFGGWACRLTVTFSPSAVWTPART